MPVRLHVREYYHQMHHAHEISGSRLFDIWVCNIFNITLFFRICSDDNFIL